MKKLSLVIVFFALNSLIYAQSDSIRSFIFGHSLIVHQPPAIPTPSDETTVPHWIHILAQEAGHSYATSGQYGFLPQHANLPPFSQWGFDLVPPVWDSDNDPFSEADFTTILLTAANFVQYQPAQTPYDGGNGITSPLSATIEIVDWVRQEEDSLRIYIYENWPDMAGFIANEGFPPSAPEFTNYNTYTLGDFHNWWLDYQDSLLVARPNSEVKMIPVGPILSKLLTDPMLSGIPITELYEDNAPHGRASLYFLAGLISYMAIYQEIAPAAYQVPNIVHIDIQNNYAAIVNMIWTELLLFNFSNGDSRVFFEQNLASPIEKLYSTFPISISPNPSSGLFQIQDYQETYLTSLYSVYGAFIQNFNISSSGEIDITHLAEGIYFLRIQDRINGRILIGKIVKK